MAEIRIIQSEESNWEYHNPTGYEFPIMASDPRPPYPKNETEPGSKIKPSVSECEFKRLHLCGFNLVRMITRNWNIQKSSLNVHVDVDFDVTVADKSSEDIDDITNAISAYQSIDHVKMFDFGDETPMEKMDEASVIREAYNQVRDMTQLPIFNNGEQADEPENLNKLQEWFRPPVWSYDWYPVMQKWDIRRICDEDGKCSFQKIGPHENELPYVSEKMYLQLERYRDMAARTQRPFWYYVQCMSYCGLKDKVWKDSTAQCTLRPVSEKYMRFSAFSALAYGAKGLRYWAYSLRGPSTDKDGNYTEAYFDAPINLDNEKTSVWYWVKAVNEEVHALGKIFLHSDVSAVYHTGDSLPLGTTGLPDGFGPLIGLESAKAGVTVSFFTSGGKNYVMLVNHDINAAQQVRISWKTAYTRTQIADELGVKKHYSIVSSGYVYSEGDSLGHRVDTIELEKCGYCIFSYETNMEYENPTGAEFPIVAGQPCQEWVSPVTGDMFKGLKECGFNLVNTNRSIWKPVETAKVLGESEVEGLFMSVSGLSWNDTARCVSQVREYAGLDSAKIWDLYSDIAADPLADHIEQFAQTYNAVRELDTGRLLLWNVLGSTFTGKPNTLTEINELARPSMWCDYAATAFTQRCDASGVPVAGRAPVMVSHYYERLEYFSHVSRTSGRPFWHYVGCMSHHTAGVSFMIPVSEAIMRVAAFSGLAYGAKGIRWWGYAIRKSSTSVTYFHAPIDAEGNRTYVWEMVKWVNDDIRRFGGIFLNARDHAVYHTGDTIPDGTTRAPGSVGPFLSFKADGRGVLLSLFKSGDKTYAMVVNHESYYPQDVTVSYNPVLTRIKDLADNRWTVLSTKADNGESVVSIPDTGEGKVATETCTLRPGGFALIEYVQYELTPPKPQ